MAAIYNDRTIALCTWLGLFAFATSAVAQSNEPPVIVTLHGQSIRLLGFVATGPEQDLDRLLSAAAATPFAAKKLFSPNSPNGPEVMVLFKPGSDPGTAVEFLRRARSSEFVNLKIGVITYPVNSQASTPITNAIQIFRIHSLRSLLPKPFD